MKKIIDLIAEPKTHKDEKLLNYVRKNYLKNSMMTKVCFVYGHGGDNHIQLTSDELRKLMFNNNDKNTIYFLSSFYFSDDRAGYLKLMEDACNNDIQIFKTDQIEKHITDDEKWTDKYCQFLHLEDLEKNCIN